jgi:PE family
MSYVVAVPEMMTSAATELDSLGSMLSEAHAVAAARTVAVLPAAGR